MGEHVLYLCASDRAARAFRRRLANRPGAVPDCVDLERFCRDLWQRGRLYGLITDDRELLDTRVVAMLWRHIVATGSELSAAEISRIASLASEAWTIGHRHHFPLQQLPAFASGGDNLALFAGYVTQMQASLRRNSGVTGAQLMTVLAESLEQLRPLLPDRVVLTPAFTSSPAQKRLLDRLVQLGVRVEPLREASTAAVPVARRFTDPAAEMRAAVSWAGECINAGAHEIAIVVPNLASVRGEWLSALREQLGGPEWALDPAQDREHFNLSIGLSLADYPHVSALLTVLRAVHAEADTESLMQALMHPRWGRSSSQLRQIERRGMALLKSGIHRSRLGEWASVLPDAIAPALEFAYSRMQTRAAHAITIDRLVNTAGSRPMIAQSDLFQLEEAWSNLVQSWVASDRWLQAVSWSAALRELGELAAETLFQPVAGQAQLQVMGLLESAGMPVGSLWITGMHDGVLPERLRPNPMLPLAWQAQQQVGLGSRDEIDARAMRLWRNWQNLSASMVVSYAREGEGSSLRGSPLLRGLPVEDTARAPDTSAAEVVALQQSDEALPAIADTQVRTLSARTLEDQAACPRRAAAVRLGLDEWPEHAVGIPARLRGMLVHEAMAALGRERMTGGDLLSRDVLHSQAMRVLDACIDRERVGRPHIPELVWQCERRRVDALIWRVLQLESTRQGFTVEAVESDLRADFDGARFSLRADRVDRALGSTAAGHHARVVFDYKTGKVARKDWFADISSGRLAAPQLPLYALLLTAQDDTAPVRALAFIVVSDDECKFVAVGEDETVVPQRTAKNDPPWDSLIDAWRGQIGALIAERRAGVAELAPLKGMATCRHCAFGPFCREPWSLAGEGEGEAVDEAGDE